MEARSAFQSKDPPGKLAKAPAVIAPQADSLVNALVNADTGQRNGCSKQKDTTGPATACPRKRSESSPAGLWRLLGPVRRDNRAPGAVRPVHEELAGPPDVAGWKPAAERFRAGQLRRFSRGEDSPLIS